MSNGSQVLHTPDCNKTRRTKPALLSNAGRAHLGPQAGSQAQPTGTHPPPLPPEILLEETAQLSLEIAKRTDARTEVTEIQIMRTSTHVRRFLPDMGTGLGTGMQRTDLTVTGRTNSHTCMVWRSGQQVCNARPVHPSVFAGTGMTGNVLKKRFLRSP